MLIETENGGSVTLRARRDDEGRPWLELCCFKENRTGTGARVYRGAAVRLLLGLAWSVLRVLIGAVR